MPATFEPIATTTLGSAASSITFSSIPSMYTDLRIIYCPLSSAGNYPVMQFNNDTASNYSYTNLRGNGSTVGSGSTSSATRIFINVLDEVRTTPQLNIIDIFSYSNTSVNKTCLISNNQDRNGLGNVGRTVGLWRSTAAILSIKLFMQLDELFDAGTTATLYGIKAA